MARIDLAMARSLRVKRIDPDEIMDKANNVKTTLSSWDNCMAESYCKWPVIAAMIVGGLIVFSIVWCIIRCACCGLSCCCGFMSCFKCCGNCCGCCDSPDKKHKHLDEPYFPPAFGAKQGYAAPTPMMAGGVQTPGAQSAPAFATFETGPNGMAVDPPKKVVNEDALPPMPSWEQAAKKRISVEGEQGSVPLQQLDPATGQQMPLMTGAGGISRSASPNAGGMPPVSPYGEQQSGFIRSDPGYGAGALAGGAMIAGAAAGRGRPHDPYRQDSQRSGNGYNDQYGQNNGPGGYGRGYPPPQDEPYNPSFPNQNQNQYDNPYSPNPMNNQGYAQDRGISPMQSDRGYNDGYNAGGVGYANTASRPYNDRQYSNTNDARPQLPAGPLSNNSYGGHDDGYGAPMRGNSPPILQNTSGYGYQEPQQRVQSPAMQQGGGGYGPPQRTYTGGSTAPPSYVSRAPTMQNQGPQGYGGTRY